MNTSRVIPGNLRTIPVHQTKVQQDVINHYTDAGPDYAFWSKNYNMHFGYAKARWDCLSRERMLERMNEVVLDTLNIKENGEYVDLGCGMGAALRFAGKNYPKANFTGFTITPWQVKNGNWLIQSNWLKNAKIKLGDYLDLPLANNSVDGALAMESFCYGKGYAKSAPIKEAFRILKQGGKLTIMDGYLKKTRQELSSFTRGLHDLVASNWALDNFPEIHHQIVALQSAGFKEVEWKEISWKIAPSAVHAPFVTLWYLIKKKATGQKIGKESWRNLRACFASLFLGMQRQSFGYFQITATK